MSRRGSRAARAVRRLRATELGGLASDSFWVAATQGSVSVADLVQIALIAHVLGLEDYGRFALVVGFVVLVSQLFDIRVGTAATTLGARRLARDFPSAAGIFQLSFIADFATGVLALVVVAGLAPFVGPALVGDDGTSLILLYALTLFISTVDESSQVVLRVLDRFRLVAAYSAALEAVRVAFVAVALVTFESLTGVILALLAYEALGAVVNVFYAMRVFRLTSGGVRLTTPALGSAREDRPELLRMLWHSNIVSYARVAQVQLPTVLLGALANATEVGLYKIGIAAAAAVSRLIEPVRASVLPRFARLWAAEGREQVRHLIQRITRISIPVVVVVFLAVVLLRTPILEAVGGEDAAEAGGVLILGAVDQAIFGMLFWAYAVFFIAGKSRVVSRIAVAGVVLQVVLLAPLILAMGALGAALALLVSRLVTNLSGGYLAWKELTVAGGPGADSSAELDQAPVRALEATSPASETGGTGRTGG